jgi:hypothetical protein
MSAADRVIVGAAGATVVGLAGVAGVADPGPGSSERMGTGPRLVSGGQASTGTDPVGLEDAARVVRDRLVAAGEPVNRRNLAAGLRSAGHRVRNDRLGHLLQVVNTSDPETASPVGVPATAVARGGDRD